MAFKGLTFFEKAKPHQPIQPVQKCTEKTVTVIYPYERKLDDELAMKPGDVITVDNWDLSRDWAKGTLNNKTGVFYKAFMKPSSKVPSPGDFKLKEVRSKPEGYDTTYRRREYILKEKLDEVECIISRELADNVHQTACCGSTVCLQCALQWKEKNDSCPHCRKAPLEIIADPKTQRRITGATVYCPNYHFGCDWVGSFGRVAEHLETDCDLEKKNCPNSKCEEILPERFLEAHRSKLCLWRKEKCPLGITLRPKMNCCTGRTLQVCRGAHGSPNLGYCEVSTYNDIITNHHRECFYWPTRCPHSCAPYLTLRRGNIDRHVKEECPEALTVCKFAEGGCKKKVKRKDLPQHMQEAMLDHMTAMFGELIELKSDHMKLKHENEQMKKELDQLKSEKK